MLADRTASSDVIVSPTIGTVLPPTGCRLRALHVEDECEQCDGAHKLAPDISPVEA